MPRNERPLDVGGDRPRVDSPPGPPSRPERGALQGSNLLLITVDTLRADALGAYGLQLLKRWATQSRNSL